MELIKEAKPLEYAWKDVTFLVRGTATAGDKFALTNGTPIGPDMKQRWNMADMWRKIIELFVVGWRGVTQDGKDVPFSLETLARLPADPSDDIFVKLGAFIVEKTGIIDTNNDRKNESGQS